MKVKVLLTSVAMIAASLVVSTSPAQAANCKTSPFGTSISGMKFKCPDGNSFTVRPDLNGGYTDPFTTYKGRDSNGNSLRCKYDSFRNRYTCK